jgi:hypothetical protein
VRVSEFNSLNLNIGGEALRISARVGAISDPFTTFEPVP